MTRFVLPRSFLVTLDLRKTYVGALFRAASYTVFHALQPPYHAHSLSFWLRSSLGQTSRKSVPRVSSPVLITKDYWWTNHLLGVGCSFSCSTTSISEWSFDHFTKIFSGKISYIWSISATQHLSSDSRVIKGYWWPGVFSCIGCSFSRATTSVSQHLSEISTEQSLDHRRDISRCWVSSQITVPKDRWWTALSIHNRYGFSPPSPSTLR